MPEPGLYGHVPEDEYHADRESLSVSGAKDLLRAPALYQWRLDHAEEHDYFDFGSAAHAYLLGAGRPVESVDAADWRSAAARAERDRIRDEGSIPVLLQEWVRIQDMADAISHHRMASSLLDDGRPERNQRWRPGRLHQQVRPRRQRTLDKAVWRHKRRFRVWNRGRRIAQHLL